VLGVVAYFVSTRSDLPIVAATAIVPPLTGILMIAGAWREPRLLLGAAALFDLEAVLAGGLFVNGAALSILLPVVGLGLSQPVAGPRSLRAAYVAAGASALLGFLLVVTVGPVHGMTGLYPPPFALAVFATVVGLALAFNWRTTSRLVEAVDGARREIAARRTVEADLATTSQLFEAVLDSSPITTMAFRPDRIVTVWNKAAEETFGWTADEVIGRPLPLDMVPPEDRLASADRIRRTFEGDVIRGDVVRRLTKDGSERWAELYAAVVRGPDGRPIGIAGQFVDVTERLAGDEERARLAAAVAQTADSIWMQDIDNVVTYVNRAFTGAYGYEPDEIVGRHAGMIDSHTHEPAFFNELWAMVSAGQTWTGSIVNRRKDGTNFEVEAVISGVRDANGRLIGFMQTDRDVTRERALESALEREARERESIESALARIDTAATPEEIAATACAGIVGLSNVESAFVVILEPELGWVLATEGRNDQVVTAGSPIPESRLRHLRDRAGGGPWVEAWRPRPEDGPAVEAITKTGLHSTAYAPFRCSGDTIGLIGIAAYDAPSAVLLVERLPALVTFGSIVGTLIRPGLDARQRAAADRTALLDVIDGSAFGPYFQAIVDLRDGSVVGHEALTRFTDGRRPDFVFAGAARAGYGIELETACLRASIEASRNLPPDTYLSLNVSPEMILSGSLGPLLTGLPRQIVLEITEHVAIDDYDGLRRELKALGPTVLLAVDDAGAGYASFRHILELAPYFVKIDIDLVRSLDAEPARQALIAGMGYFAVKRKLHLIAEGIETKKELAALRALAVPFGQGYLLGRPRPGSEPGSWPTEVELPAFPRA
jgi:PAS domain S-box-containing protein